MTSSSRVGLRSWQPRIIAMPSSWKAPVTRPWEIRRKVSLSLSGIESNSTPVSSSVIRIAVRVRSPSRSSLRNPSFSTGFLP